MAGLSLPGVRGAPWTARLWRRVAEKCAAGLLALLALLHICVRPRIVHVRVLTKDQERGGVDAPAARNGYEGVFP